MDLIGEVNGYILGCKTTGNCAKKRNEDGDGRSSTTEECDSTTEPANSKFQIGEDVYYQEETGQNVLGTVGLIQGKRIKIIFMDGTEKWAPLSRVKKISLNFADDEEEINPDFNHIRASSPSASSISEPSCSSGVSSASTKKKSKFESNGHKESYQVTCGSCGVQKMIAQKKAVEFSPYTANQYNCRKCINKSKTNKNNGVPMIAAHYLAAPRGRPRGSDINGAMTPNKGMLEHGITNGVFRPGQSDKICLHCRSSILEKVSLHCTMCERPCHPSCLALTPPPLPGDTFWSIICHLCGTQKPDGSPENDSQKLYSSRRSITCWSDVALLLLSCLGCKHPNEKYFHLDEQVIPFWEENVTRLHLPRQYKSAEPVERRRCLLLALNNAHLRFLKDESRNLWGILERTDLNMVIKPPMVSGGRPVTAAGFPISVRANNPEAASVAMTNIAQTIAVQAAANKANNVPVPKNSPSHHVSPKSATSVKQMGGITAINSGRIDERKLGKQDHHHPVAKKSGTELNVGAQRVKRNEIWPQSRYGKTTFLPELPKTGPNNITGTHTVETLPSIVPNSQQHNNIQNRRTQSQQHISLSPSAGGAARVTGRVISSSNSSPSSSLPEVGNRMVNSGSYPVRKNGSPILNKSIRVETVEKKKEIEINDNRSSLNFDGSDRINESKRDSGNTTGFNNLVSKKLPLKRKISLSKQNESDISSATKRLKIGLPSSTDVTSKRLPSPPKSVDSDSVTNKSGQKKAMSPLQKLSDLQRNGGLTVACLKHTETGFQTVAMNPSKLEDTMDSKNGTVVMAVGNTGVLLEDFAVITPEERPSVFTTPVKNFHGATPKNILPHEVKSPAKVEEAKDDTKDKTNNVTTPSPPRAFKLASVSTPGSSKTSAPISMERRMTRPVRLKRSAADKNEPEKKDGPGAVKPMTKKLTAKDKAAALTAAAVKNSRGRPKKHLKLQLRKPNNRIIGYHGQFNGSVTPNEASESKEKENNTIDETEFAWKRSTIQDLLDYGHGYRLECLPKFPEGINARAEIAQAALKHLKDELAPRPPSYWSSTSNPPHGKKPVNQKSRRDLKDSDSYYICGRRIDQNGIQYEVVWKDGCGFEYSSEDEEELGLKFGENYLCFEEYDHTEYFRDKMPLGSSLNGNCDSTRGKSETGDMETRSANKYKDGGGGNDSVKIEGKLAPIKEECLIKLGVGSPIVKIKREPSDSEKGNKSKSATKLTTAMDSGHSKSYATAVTNGVQLSDSKVRNYEPMFIDLTDSP